VRRQPYSLVLLDEVDKAHPDVFNTLLQVLDAGRLSDSQGRTVDFRNTVVIMTSNIGAETVLASASEEPVPELSEQLRVYFRPEFLNRIDEVVVFRALAENDLRRIAGLLLERTYGQLHAKGIRLEITDDAVDWLVRRGCQPEFGARPLRRTIQRELDTRLASLILDGALSSGQRVRADVAGGQLVVAPVPHAAGWHCPQRGTPVPG
jgi:ATP-dependent Clp protease ATP-binding subunit ClpC